MTSAVDWALNTNYPSIPGEIYVAFFGESQRRLTQACATVGGISAECLPGQCASAAVEHFDGELAEMDEQSEGSLKSIDCYTVLWRHGNTRTLTLALT